MGSNCPPCGRFVLFCYERDFKLPLSGNNQAGVIEVFNSISHYLDYLLNIEYSIKIVSEYDQEIPQSQTADNPVALRRRADQPSQDTKKTN